MTTLTPSEIDSARAVRRALLRALARRILHPDSRPAPGFRPLLGRIAEAVRTEAVAIWTDWRRRIARRPLDLLATLRAAVRARLTPGNAELRDGSANPPS